MANVTIEINTHQGPAIRTKMGDILLSDLITMDFDTGSMTWKFRPREWFADSRSCMTWNSRFCGSDAFGTIGKSGYLRGRVMGVRIMAHRVVLAFANNKWPSDQVDHKNRIRSDNRPSNLREASNSDNCRNQKIRHTNTSGCSGVHWSKHAGKWQARIIINGKNKHLGLFQSLEGAMASRAKAELEHWGATERNNQ